mgnify:CR=1 FL=1
MTKLFETIGGRKMLLGMLGTISITLLACLHVISGEVAVGTITALLIGTQGAIAYEDANRQPTVESKNAK